MAEPVKVPWPIPGDDGRWFSEVESGEDRGEDEECVEGEMKSERVEDVVK